MHNEVTAAECQVVLQWLPKNAQNLLRKFHIQFSEQIPQYYLISHVKPWRGHFGEVHLAITNFFTKYIPISSSEFHVTSPDGWDHCFTNADSTCPSQNLICYRSGALTHPNCTPCRQLESAEHRIGACQRYVREQDTLLLDLILYGGAGTFAFVLGPWQTHCPAQKAKAALTALLYMFFFQGYPLLSFLFVFAIFYLIIIFL